MTASSSPPWLAEALRLSAFLSGPLTDQPDTIWQALVGRPPDEIRRYPADGRATAAGRHLNALLRLDLRPSRIDWRLSFDPRRQSTPIPSIGPYVPLANQFQELMARWLAARGPLRRLAYASVLLLPTPDLASAHAQLVEFLPAVNLDQENTRDFQYRINRRRHLPSTFEATSVRGLPINRLATWSAVELTQTIVDISGGDASHSIVENPASLTFCRLELDINTVPEHTRTLAASDLPPLFSFLVDAAADLSEHGDTP